METMVRGKGKKVFFITRPLSSHKQYKMYVKLIILTPAIAKFKNKLTYFDFQNNCKYFLAA